MLNRSRMRMVCVKAPVAGYGSYAFEREGRKLLASVQPMSGDMAQRMYGAEPSQMRRLLCEPGAELREGEGVCVDVPPDAEPDFRVVYAALWRNHVDAHLRLIPVQERGRDE